MRKYEKSRYTPNEELPGDALPLPRNRGFKNAGRVSHGASVKDYVMFGWRYFTR